MKNNELNDVLKTKLKKMSAKEMAEFVKKLIATRPEIAAKAIKAFKDKSG